MTLPTSVDVLIAGSGAAGLVAALVAAESGAAVVVVESAPMIGGTTAISGGRVWVPANTHALAAGYADSPAEGLAYFLAASPDADGELAETFVETAHMMAEWVETASPHRFEPCLHYPDYYAELPGGKAGGRALDSRPYDTTRLGRHATIVRDSPSYLPLTHDEWRRWRYAHRFDWPLLERRRAQGVTAGGRALVGALLEGCLAAGVEVVESTRIVELRMSDGRVKGATVESMGQRYEVAADACILATGGFEWNAELRNRHLREPITAFGSPPANRGDALALSLSAGAELDRMDEGWWMPMVHIPGETLDGEPFFRSLVTERGLPRSILVNGAGERFTDESLPYNDLVKSIKGRDRDGGTPNTPAWLIFDGGFRARYSLAGIRPDQPMPHWVVHAETVDDLAGALGIEGATLAETIADWNEACLLGRDQRFQRGESVYERYYGDPSQPGNPTLGPLDQSPYFAVEVHPGTIGTKGGPRVDRHSRVLRPGGEPIPGLYAAGNASAAWVGSGYPGPGATLAVGMTFAYRAAHHAAGRAV